MRVDGVVVVMPAASVIVVMGMIVSMLVVVSMLVIMVETSMVMLVIMVETSMVMIVSVGRIVVVVVVVMVLVIARVPVGVVMGAHADGPVPVEEIERAQKKEADPRDQGVDPEAGIEVFFDPSARVKVEEETAPQEKGENRERLEDFLHGFQGKGFPGRRVRAAAKRNSGRRSRQRARAREGKQSAI
jgi:hypothetical protein